MKTLYVTQENHDEVVAELRRSIGMEVMVSYPDGRTEVGRLVSVDDEGIEIE